MKLEIDVPETIIRDAAISACRQTFDRTFRNSDRTGGWDTVHNQVIAFLQRESTIMEIRAIIEPITREMLRSVAEDMIREELRKTIRLLLKEERKSGILFNATKKT